MTTIVPRFRDGLLRAAAPAAAILLAAAAAPDAWAQGCAMCRTAIEGSDDPLARSLSWSGLMMLSMPFAIFTTVAGWLVYAHRRAGAAPPEGGAALETPAPGRSEQQGRSPS